MKIYPVVLIPQLEPAKGNDPYNRKKPDHPGLVEMEKTTQGDNKSKDIHNGIQAKEVYKVKQILGKRLRKYGRSKPRTKYRVKWVGWGPK